jgi:hypothetical protein
MQQKVQINTKNIPQKAQKSQRQDDSFVSDEAFEESSPINQQKHIKFTNNSN